MKKIYIPFIVTLLISLTAKSQNIYSQNFDDVPTMLTTGGWTQQNSSIPLGTEIWHNEDGNGIDIPAYNGAANSCAVASYLSTGTITSGTISNWLISPTLNIDNGDVVSFYTTSFLNSTYADRLQLRLNTNNTTWVGTSDTSVGDFTIILIDINPNLIADSSLYPEEYWGQYTATISGLSGSTPCSIAFRYFVTDAGLGGNNSSTIGVDAFSVDMPVGINEFAEDIAMTVYPNPTTGKIYLSFDSGIRSNTTVNVIDLPGHLVYSEKISSVSLSNRKEIDLSNLAKGMYILNVQNERNERRNMRIVIE